MFAKKKTTNRLVGAHNLTWPLLGCDLPILTYDKRLLVGAIKLWSIVWKFREPFRVENVRLFGRNSFLVLFLRGRMGKKNLLSVKLNLTLARTSISFS